MNIVERSRKLMYEQTRKNKAPAWLLTELSIRKGKQLARQYKVNEKLVLTSLYLAHTVFSSGWKTEVQKHHPALSAKFVKPYLDKWRVAQKEQVIILNAIEAHHAQVPTRSKIAEVVKNAECFKFVTLEGSLIWFHDCGLRGWSLEEAVERVLHKMEQKRKLLTLPRCKREAAKNCKTIVSLFGSLNKKKL